VSHTGKVFVWFGPNNFHKLQSLHIAATMSEEDVNQTIPASVLDDAAAPEEVEQPEDVIRLTIKLPDGTEWQVPSGAYAGDTAEFLRSLLSETAETCHLTSYSFRVLGGESEQALNDFQELGNYIADPNDMNLRLQVKLDNYTVRSARDHVKRCRELLKFPAYMASISPPSAAAESSSSENPSEEVQPTVDSIVQPRAADLGSFYAELLDRTGKADPACLGAGSGDAVADIIKSICESGWNAPPTARSLQGDLLYLEVVTAAEGVHQITCTGAGFYINRSSRSNFDARPAAKPCFHHELLHTLFAAFPLLSKSWTAQQERLAAAMASSTRVTRPLDQSATLFAQGRPDAFMVQKQWNVPATAGVAAAASIYDAGSAQDAIGARFGIEPAGPPREWNEDLQTSRGIPGVDQNQRLLRSKITSKTMADFRVACEAAVVAIVEGHIMPFNPMDDASSHVYLHNGIFFSGAVDTKDTFKLAQGEVACRKYAAHDLKNQRRVQALEIPGLHTVVQMLVDYKGHRLLSQTVIPGVLSASGNASRLMVGAVEQGQRLHVKTDAFAILQELGKRTGMAERNVPTMPSGPKVAQTPTPGSAYGLGLGLEEPVSAIRIDEDDELVSADAASVPHVGPLEGKLIKGSDGRVYVLELTRLTPRDANYIAADQGGTGLVSGVVDGDLASAYLLRPELLSAFKISEREAAQQVVVQRYMAEEQERKEKLTAALAAEAKAKPADAVAIDPAVPNPLELEYTVQQTKSSTAMLAEVAAVDKVVSEKQLEINPNVFFAQIAADVDPAVVKQDEATARQLATFLHDVVCPALTAAVRKGDRAAPLDCAAAARLMHDSGINMRYLGRLAALAREEERTSVERRTQGTVSVYGMPGYWRDLLEAEMVARSVKTLLNSMFAKDAAMRECPAPTVAAVLSAILGTGEPDIVPEGGASAGTDASAAKVGGKSKKNKSKNKGAKTESGDVDGVITVPAAHNAATSAAEVLDSIDVLLKSRFMYSLKDIQTTTIGDYNAKRAENAEAIPDSVGGGPLGLRLSRLLVLRRICQQCGLRVVSRTYTWTGAACVRADDIAGLVPRVKSCEAPMVSPDASALLVSSSDFLKKGELNDAYRAAQEALQLLTQIVGPVHSATAEANEALASILATAGDNAMALVMHQKNLMAWVQLKGYDSPEAINAHLQCAAFHTELGSVAEAMPHLLAARYGVELVGTMKHPMIVQVIQKVAENMAVSPNYEPNTVYQLLAHARDLCSSLVYKAYFGIMLAGILRNLNFFEDAIAEMKKAYELLSATFGPADERVMEAKEQLTAYRREFTGLKVNLAKLEQARTADQVEKSKENVLKARIKQATQSTSQKEAEAATSEARKKLHELQKQRRARR